MTTPSAPPGRSRPDAGPQWRSGAVTRLATPSVVPEPATPTSPGGAVRAAPPGAAEKSASRRQLMWFGGAAAAVLLIGLVVVLAAVLTGGGEPFWRRESAPRDARPPLARACPAPAATSAPGRPAPTAPAAGPRTVDAATGISYKAYQAPWRPWTTVWRAGTLAVRYAVGQHFVTEEYAGGLYHASILSGSVPAADNDAITFNLECVGRQVAADVRAEYYPQPNRMDLLRNQRTVLGGRPAWVTEFRLHFHEPGLTATDELAAVACIDVGRPRAAILYVSIPGTHRQFDWVVDDVLASVRPAG